MTSEELAVEIEAFVIHAITRVRGTGDDQYSEGDVQNFEGLNLDDLFLWAEEELVDTVNYSVMLAIRLRRLQKEIAKVIAGVTVATS